MQSRSLEWLIGLLMVFEVWSVEGETVGIGKGPLELGIENHGRHWHLAGCQCDQVTCERSLLPRLSL